MQVSSVNKLKKKKKKKIYFLKHIYTHILYIPPFVDKPPASREKQIFYSAVNESAFCFWQEENII